MMLSLFMIKDNFFLSEYKLLNRNPSTRMLKYVFISNSSCA